LVGQDRFILVKTFAHILILIKDNIYKYMFLKGNYFSCLFYNFAIWDIHHY
jgi:hypothetical protein